ncbi:MAG: preprotein translocase subunit SecE [Chloroflexi bacterium RBG_19FT_COMBO_48_23]|nr:MAG: preprotein translocase subunit SecE [Chloroflexi bacterium RBG_19FT_COMBO_48_23]
MVAKKRSRFAFIGEIIGELRKVTWPSRRDTVRLTIMVIIVCVLVGLFLGALDYGFSELVAKVLLGGS